MSCQQIEKQLDLLQDQCKNDLSFYTGKVGISLCYYLLAKHYHGTRNTAIANSLIKYIVNHFEDINSFSFSKGVLGIGWGLEMINQNGFTHLDMNRILYDFDDLIYKQSCFFKSTALSLDNGSLGKAMYFYQRVLSNKTQYYLSYRSILNQECLLLLVNEIKYYLLDEKVGLLNKDDKLTKDEIIEISQSIVLLFYIHKLNLIPKVISNIIHEIILFIEKIFEDTSNISLTHIYFLNSYFVIANSLNNNEMKNRLNQWRLLYNSVDDESNIDLLERYIIKSCIFGQIQGNYNCHENIGQLSLLDIFINLDSVSMNVLWQQAWLIK